MFLGKRVLKIRSKFKGEYPCRSAVSIKLHSTLIEITLQHGFSPTNLLHISGIPGGPLLNSKKLENFSLLNLTPRNRTEINLFIILNH